MKNFFLITLILLSLAASGQYSYPRFFQQVNRSNTNRFTTGGALSYRWLQLTDSLENDTISILPSAYTNIYTLTGSAGSPDSINRNVWINANMANTYLNDLLQFNATVASEDTIFFNTNFSNGTTIFGPTRVAATFIRTTSNKWSLISTSIE